MSAASYTFIIVGEGDCPVYEAEFLAAQKKDSGQDTSHLNQLIIHAALDMVDDAVWTNNAMCGAHLRVRGTNQDVLRVLSSHWRTQSHHRTDTLGT